MNEGQGDVLAAADGITASLLRPTFISDALRVRGLFRATCLRRGEVVWEDEFENTVVTVGKNLILDEALAAAAYTATEYMGLISGTGWSAISAGDTMGSHAGWTEVIGSGAPSISGTRGACAWSAAAAGSKALSANPAFTVTGAGTVKGAFLVGGAGATSALGNAAGTLISAGLFTGGDRAVLVNDTVSVAYSMSI